MKFNETKIKGLYVAELDPFNDVRGFFVRTYCNKKFEEMKMQERAISIDVIIPYNTTNKTIGQATDIRAAFTRDLLEEFAVFGEMRPLQIKSISLDGINLNQNPEFILSSNLSIIGSERSILSEDYSSFFSGLSANGKLEDETIHFLNKWFKTNNLIDYGSAIIVDVCSRFFSSFTSNLEGLIISFQFFSIMITLYK